MREAAEAAGLRWSGQRSPSMRRDPSITGYYLLPGARLVELSGARSEEAEELFTSMGLEVEWLERDAPGGVAGRIVCQLVNEAAFAIGEGVGSAADVDAGMTLGLNHPRGPGGLGRGDRPRGGAGDDRGAVGRAARGALPLRTVAAPRGGARGLAGGSCGLMATADLTVIALGRNDPSAGEYIAEIHRRLAAQDRVRYQLHAMGTSLEGSAEDILAIVGELHAVPFESGIPRVYTVLKLDERRDRPDQTLDDKVRSVEDRLSG